MSVSTSILPIISLVPISSRSSKTHHQDSLIMVHLDDWLSTVGLLLTWVPPQTQSTRASVMNAIFLQSTMESIGIPTRVQTAFRMSEVAEPYIYTRKRAVRHVENGRVVIFAAGTGNLFFTTDTAADLRCAEINAEVVLKATNTDGVLDDDPRHNPNVRLRDTITYHEVMSKDLSVMDMTAITLCQENNIPVVVFNLNEPGNISKAIKGERVGTLIGGTQNSEVSRT